MYTTTFRTNIATAADKSALSRYALASVYVNPYSKLAAATDGRMLAVVPVEVEGDDTDAPALLPLGVVNKPTARKPCVVECNDQARNPATAVTLPYHEGRYPALADAIKGAALAADAGCVRLTLDADLLHKLAQAISLDAKDLTITLAVPFDSEGVCTQSVGVVGTGGVGVLMPKGTDPALSVSSKLRDAAAIDQRL